MNILTKNPEVWKKTVFILCYDENDGYFDHVPPFVAPHPDRPDTGKVSEGMDTSVDVANVHGRDSSVGLGFRVPLVVASPWSRGGSVNSQIFDHTSILQFLETWLDGKGKKVTESNISDWRRTVCGDLTSCFRPYNGEAMPLPKSLERDATVEGIHAAKFKGMPKGGSALTPAEIRTTDVRPGQESGSRPSCPLPYELVVNAAVNGNGLDITLEARKERFGKHAAGGAFNAYSYDDEMKVRSYAVRPGGTVRDHWALTNEAYHVRIDGANGFMREFQGHAPYPELLVQVDSTQPKVKIHLVNNGSQSVAVEIVDEAYGLSKQTKNLPVSGKVDLVVDTAKSHGWYDFTVRSGTQIYRYAGRVETGQWSVTDPAMG